MATNSQQFCGLIINYFIEFLNSFINRILKHTIVGLVLQKYFRFGRLQNYFLFKSDSNPTTIVYFAQKS